MDYRKEETWTDGRYEYERLPRHRLPPREPPPDAEYRRVVSVVRRPEEEAYQHYEEYSDPDYREYDEPHAYERRTGPYRGEDPAYRWGRGETPVSRQPEYRESREGFRRKPLYHSGYARDRSPHRRESPFFRESPVSRKDSPHSRSGSSVSSRSYSPERSKNLPPRHHRNKERPGTHTLRSSKDPSPSSSVVIPPAKGVEIDKGSRLAENAFIEAASKWVAEKMEKAPESSLPEVVEEFVKAGSYSLYADEPADTEANISVNPEFYESAPLNNRTRAIASKTKEIEEVYRQDCETFGMVVKMLIDKDPSLEKQIQFALRQNLSEIGERCIEELKVYITDYDAANQDLA